MTGRNVAAVESDKKLDNSLEVKLLKFQGGLGLYAFREVIDDLWSLAHLMNSGAANGLGSCAGACWARERRALP